MAKFYITARYLQCLVQAEDAEGAALWALHQAISEGTSRSGEAFSPEQILGLLAQWGPKIFVSEVGYGRADAGVFRTDETLENYWELVDALERLCARWEDREASAGDIAPDSVSEHPTVFRGGVELPTSGGPHLSGVDYDSHFDVDSTLVPAVPAATWCPPFRTAECQCC